MSKWFGESVFYHIYPMGFCGAPLVNDFGQSELNTMDSIFGWIEHIKSLGINALYLGPICESTSHGYDTADYFKVDRRLGSSEILKKLCNSFNNNGIRIVFDGVFNHVGRDFWAFRDVLEKRENSQFKDWFKNINFSGRSCFNDPFSYEGWNGHFNLVKLNLSNTDVKNHIFHAVSTWIEEYNISGIRLDAADCLDIGFLKELSEYCRSLRDDFFLLGEVIHGDYRKWTDEGGLDSVTNYELYKGLYSSHVDKNYFEIAYSLKRQFGNNGMYKQIPMYSFADNHDVNRVASSLKNKAHLFPLYCLLFTVPGIPSIYYGSEWGIEGVKYNGNDQPLRPRLNLSDFQNDRTGNDLKNVISKLSGIRANSKALKYGNYTQIHVNHEQFAFMRQFEDETIIVAVNSSEKKCEISAGIPGIDNMVFQDLMNVGETQCIQNGQLKIRNLYPNWCTILYSRH